MVIGLHGSPPLGARMGSVTYRLLSQAPVLTLALPPEWTARLQLTGVVNAVPTAAISPIDKNQAITHTATALQVVV